MLGYSAVSYDKFYTFAYSILPVAVIDMQPLLTKSTPTFVNIYGELPAEQKEVGTQADMFWQSHHQSSQHLCLILRLAQVFVMRKQCMSDEVF